MKPIYALRHQHENDRYLRTLERRVRDRMVAGRMAIGFLKEAATGEVPACIKRLSINEMAQLVLDDVQYSEPENVETRIWRPSLPVIHLASALQLLLHLAEPVTGPIGLEALLLGRNVIELLVRGGGCMTPPTLPFPWVMMSRKACRSRLKAIARRSSGWSNGATSRFMTRLRLTLVGLSSQNASGAWLLTSLVSGTDRPPKVMSNLPETNVSTAVDTLRMMVYSIPSRYGWPGFQYSGFRVSLIASFGLNSTSLNGPVPIGRWRISRGGTWHG